MTEIEMRTGHLLRIATDDAIELVESLAKSIAILAKAKCSLSQDDMAELLQELEFRGISARMESENVEINEKLVDMLREKIPIGMATMWRHMGPGARPDDGFECYVFQMMREPADGDYVKFDPARASLAWKFDEHLRFLLVTSVPTLVFTNTELRKES